MTKITRTISARTISHEARITRYRGYASLFSVIVCQRYQKEEFHAAREVPPWENARQTSAIALRGDSSTNEPLARCSIFTAMHAPNITNTHFPRFCNCGCIYLYVTSLSVSLSEEILHVSFGEIKQLKYSFRIKETKLATNCATWDKDTWYYLAVYLFIWWTSFLFSRLLIFNKSYIREILIDQI